MMEQKNYESPTKSPVVQEIIMSNRIGAIAIHLSKQLNIDHVQALKLFYKSKTCANLHDKSTRSLSIWRFICGERVYT